MEALTEEAFQKAECHTERNNFDSDYDICLVALDYLVDILEDIMQDSLPINDFVHDVKVGEVGPNEESLWQPLLCLAAFQIDLPTVAEAMFIKAGRWYQDSPEMLNPGHTKTLL